MSTADTISVLIVEPEKAPYVKEIGSGLESLQAAVGGYIEAAYPFREPVVVIVNEEGKLNGLPLNRALRDDDGEIYDIVAGTMVIAGLGEEDFESLTQDEIELFTDKFRTPEYFVMINGKITALPMEPHPEPPRESEVPVYRHPGSYAREHGQLTEYRDSFRINRACKDAIEQTIADKYADNRLAKDAAAGVVERFGIERVEYVLANTIRMVEWDGRYSNENKAWAKSVGVVRDVDSRNFDRNLEFRVTHSHPGLVNLFTNQVRRLSAERGQDRPSVVDRLHEKTPAAPSIKKEREQER